MNIIEWESLSEQKRAALLERPAPPSDAKRRDAVAEIMAGVRARGDDAVREYARRFDKAEVSDLVVPEAEIEAAWNSVGAEVKTAMAHAAARIEQFHKAQLPATVTVETAPGVTCERRWLPLESVGLYAPGGTAPLVSTVLMLGIPAKLAGCRIRVLATPPGRDGQVDPRLLAAAKLAGVTTVVRAGGAQAIAALAYGTASIPKVDKIFGPGNAWVAEAKRQAAEGLAGTAMDLPAGPSEVFIVADGSANPAFVAADLLAQAEHGEDSQVFLASPSRALLDGVKAELGKQLKTLPRAEIAKAALANSVLAFTHDLETAFQISESYAPEHLILQTREDEALSARVRHAGAVFLGPWSPEAVGDYAAGPNHVLPTGGAARARGGLGLESFLKPVTFQRLTHPGLQMIASDIAALAAVEGLDAHARSVAVREA